MTRKKCIKLIMGTVGLPQPWEAEKVFRATREWMYGETGPWPSNQEVLMAILSTMVKGVDIGMPFTTCFLSASTTARWAALQKKPKREPKPQPLNQGGGFRKTGHSLPII